MQVSVSNLITQFTEDVFTKEDRICQQSWCQALIHKGEPFLYVATYDPAQPGKFVCEACHRWYKNKPATIAQAQNTNGIITQSTVHTSVHKCCTVMSFGQPPAIMAMSNAAPNLGNLAMLIPPLPMPTAHHNSKFSPAGPSVQVPSTWQNIPQPANSPANAALGHMITLPPGSTGYSAQHVHYAAQHECWAHMAHNLPPAETISLEIWAVFEAGGKKKNLRANNIGSICEGLKDIDMLSTVHELLAIALGILVLHIKDYCPQFPCNWKGSKVKVFKPKQFMLFIIVPVNQWEEFEEFQEKLHSSPPAHKQQTSWAGLSTSLPGSTVSMLVVPRSTMISEPSTLFFSKGVVSTTSSSMFDHPILHDVAHLWDGEKDMVLPTNSSVMSGKCHHRHTSSSSSGSTPLLPQKRSAKTFLSPNCNQIKKALQSGGASEFNVKTVFWQKVIQVDFYPIQTHDLNDLVSEKAAFNIRNADLCSGKIRLNASADSIIGVGAFKMAQIAQLNLSPLRDMGIGSSPNNHIVLKRPYIDDHPVEVKPPFTHYALQDKSNILYRKANTLYWAKALLQMMYQFIDHAVEDTKVPPPFEIPHLHFVDAGLLFAYLDVPAETERGSGKPSKPSSIVNVTYLVEELIHTSSDDEFVKYIHNGDVAPCFLLDTKAEEIADFLAFTQHVQYIMTGGQVYISDYQGSRLLLTDPQILTHLDVAEGRRLFSEGNVEKGVALFENQHICNLFCRWEGFGMKAFSHGSKSLRSTT
ncbi:hypothetical protein F5J12DRAFT_784910 [Pisolithus orientalis]|uniref:uncharacterized protein n=1 Tax=Pisolithus orientalis TaxID=936130 RepID=UPI0022251C63|nr:uncharacterized protein F5J12DRAFT_784910 [Pisolithus orientalis]KAI5998324.1 hypothetical protein F5J12DRAFT_784910 [Pisolithus orientalis]